MLPSQSAVVMELGSAMEILMVRFRLFVSTHANLFVIRSGMVLIKVRGIIAYVEKWEKYVI
jgi:hypothetical protein